MRKRTGTRARLLAGAVGAFGSVAMLPSTVNAAESGRQIEEVIVTAERKEASIQDTSISISAFTGEFIEDFGIRNQEDLQNYIPATTFQPYDATVRGVGRNFRALGGDPGVATYQNGIYSEDLLTATAQSFFDVERVEVLRGPQGTLYGRNAVGGAINILYKEPTDEFEAIVKTLFGNQGTQEYMGAISGPLIQDQLSTRITFTHRERDGWIDDIAPTGEDFDSLEDENIAVQFRWTPFESVEVNLRRNWMDNDRVFGGANGGPLMVLSEKGQSQRDTSELVPGYRFITTGQTANRLARDFHDTSRPVLQFTDPVTGAVRNAQALRAGIDHYGANPGVIAAPNLNGFQNAAASLTGFNRTSAADAAAYNDCLVGSGTIRGDDLCAASNGFNWESFKQRGTQFNITWDATDNIQLKYLYGNNTLAYQRITDDDNTGSLFHDRQFYVNHEADYESHELQAFVDITDSISFTSGIFFYDATIDQRGDFYSSLQEAKYRDAYNDRTSFAPLGGISASTLAFGTRPMVNLYSAKNSCNVATPAPSCARNFAVNNLTNNNNLQTSRWYGDPGTDPNLSVTHGPNTVASDLLYHTQTKRDAFAAYTQGVWDINEVFTLTLGLRYAEDEVIAEENLWRYSETGALNAVGNPGFLGLFGGLAAVNITNGGLIANPDGTFTPTPAATNGGIPFALSVYRPFERKDKEWTWRANLDWNITDDAMMYFSATSGYRSGGFALVYFSRTPTYEPEELISYEIGYKTQWLDNALQVNGSFYLYDYESIHSFASEVSEIGGVTTSVLAAPGAEISGIEAEVIWLATDNLSFGGNFSYTPSKYTKSFFLSDPSESDIPPSLFPNFEALTQDIKGNQLLQVPELKFVGYGAYRFDLAGGSSLEFTGTYSWTDKMYFTPFESDVAKADSFGRLDARANWRSEDDAWLVSGFINNITDEVGILFVGRNGEGAQFRTGVQTTQARTFGVEVQYTFSGK
ncbi:MAG: TonB-dependent receptor [Gammaproteobacteria bacterium]|nr:TonB-dependent receptor [Gammaproteobacteria bacterium]